MTPLPRPSSQPLRDAIDAVPAWARNACVLTMALLGGCARILVSFVVVPIVLEIEERGVFGDAVAFDGAEWKRNADDPFVRAEKPSVALAYMLRSASSDYRSLRIDPENGIVESASGVGE